MTILKKDMVPVVKLGTPEVQAVVGHPARAAYWSVERTYEQGYLFVEGVTIQKVSVFTLQDTLIAHAPLITGGTIPIWMDLDFVTASAWEYVAYLNGDRLEFSQNTTWDLEKNKTIYAYNTNATGILAARAIPVAQATTFVTETRVYHPAVPAVASVAYRPATPTIIEWAYNAGWNTYAVSIGSVADGQFVEFKVPSGDSGVFVGLGPSSKYGQPLSAFDFGVLATVDGIKVYERGKVVRSLTNNINTRYTVRILNKDGRVSYSVLNDSTYVASYDSARLVPLGQTMIAHGYLYRGGDTIADAVIQSTPSVPMPAGFKTTLRGAGALQVVNVEAYLLGTATVTIAFNGAKLRGRSALYEVVLSERAGKINGTLPPVSALLFDDSFSGAIHTTIPAIEGRFAEEYVPPRRQTIDLTLPPLSFYGFMSRSRGGSINATLPPVQMKGGTFDYGEILVEIPPVQGFAYEDPIPGMGFLFSSGLAQGSLSGIMDHVFIFNSTGQLVDSYSGSREMMEALVETLQAQGELSAVGSFTVNFSSEIEYNDSVSGVRVKGGVDLPGVDQDARVWVVNTDTGASVQYDDYGFNSFFERDGEYFGVAEDGIYKLSGATDAGVPIEALVDYGRSTFGTPQRKRLMNVYAGVSSTNRMLLKVSVDGDTYIYEARSSESGHLKHHRFDLGRGLAGTHWRIEVLNRAGCDFDMESLEFEPVVLSRKI